MLSFVSRGPSPSLSDVSRFLPWMIKNVSESGVRILIQLYLRMQTTVKHTLTFADYSSEVEHEEEVSRLHVRVRGDR
jgi:hypothetical protein